MLRLLAKGSLGMLPEGIAGTFHGATPAREALYLSPRRGFVRLAIQAGTGACLRPGDWDGAGLRVCCEPCWASSCM